MIIRQVLENKRIDSNVREALAAGLALGLTAALFAGLVAGLNVRLVDGLSVGLSVGLGVGFAAALFAGLVDGLVAGLIAGLSVGLGVGLGVGLVAGLLARQYGLPTPIIIVLGISAFIEMELLYYLAVRKKPQANVSLWWVLGRKLEELGEVLVINVNGLNVWWVLTKAGIDWPTIGNGIKTFGEYLIFILAALAIIVGWLWLNKKIVPIKESNKPTSKGRKSKQ